MERVLVVDDERECRHALADAIAAKGFEPETAEDGSAALKRIQKDPAGYGLVYTDLCMPQVGGLELVSQLAGLDPTIVAVLLTGHTSPASAVDAAELDSCASRGSAWLSRDISSARAR